MIKLDELRESDRGRAVINTRYGKAERGVIVSWNGWWVFVYYDSRKGDNVVQKTAPAHPRDLNWGKEGEDAQ